MTPIGKFQKSIIPLLREVPDLIPDPENARVHGDENMEAIRTSLSTFGQVTPIVYWRDRTGALVVIKGNGTFQAAKDLGWSHIAAMEFEGSETYARAYAIADNRSAELAEWDTVRLQFQLDAIETNWDSTGEVAWDTRVVGWSPTSLEEVAPRKKTETSSPPSEVPEAVDAEFSVVVNDASLGHGRETVRSGDVFELVSPSGLAHRVMCGDSTKSEDVSALMDGAKASLLHADGPYGMGKEEDGVANDNLRGAKLDAFQVAWWNVAARHLVPKASAYIWGNAPDLWRLWYRYLDPQMDAKEVFAAVALPLSVRNEIVWVKGNGTDAAGSGSPDMRSFAENTERALFLMAGEREPDANENADEYWEGWDELREGLRGELAKTGWTDKEVAKVAGVTGKMASHWFGKSQWTMIPEERYLKLQEAAHEADAFQMPYADVRAFYEELKTRFDADVRAKRYANRAYFDNTHEAMTELWQYPRVVGEERFGHPTPKPVLMIVRALRTSCPEGEIVLDPFAGSGSTLIAAEESGRRCFTMEITPEHVATTIKRWEAKTGALATRVAYAEVAA